MYVRLKICYVDGKFNIAYLLHTQLKENSHSTYLSAIFFFFFAMRDKFYTSFIKIMPTHTKGKDLIAFLFQKICEHIRRKLC